MRFLIDMNLSPKWVEALQQSEMVAVHWSNIGPANAKDPDIMRYAFDHDFVVLTNDLDFGSILAATGGNAPSVIQLRTDDCRVGSIGVLVIQILQQVKEVLASGALVTIETERVRITSLPIGRGA